ncbi:MAG: hypothetical protein WD080_02640 [Egibacteraceae bacterium]
MNDKQAKLPIDGARLDIVRAVVALVAGQRNVVAADEADVDLAMTIVDVFAHHPDGGALTVEQVAQGCGTSTADATFRSRFDLLVHEGVLRRRHGKAHQQRYTLNPAAYSGRLVFDRLRSDQGVSELIRLLDATLRLLERQRATVVEVGGALRSMRTMLRGRGAARGRRDRLAGLDSSRADPQRQAEGGGAAAGHDDHPVVAAAAGDGGAAARPPVVDPTGPAVPPVDRDGVTAAVGRARRGRRP